MRKTSLKLLGLICVGLGTVGVFLPLMPTTPFLLLAIFFFARSSPKYSYRLLHNPILGPYIRGYIDGTGMARGIKIRSLCVLWVSISVTCVFLTKNIYVIAFLLIMATSVSIHIARMKTAK